MKIRGLMKKTLSVLLACAMSVTVFTACGEKDNDKGSKSLSAKEMLLEVFNTAANSNAFSGIFSGKANYASKSESVIEFGEGVTKALGTEVKPLSLTFETKLKGSNAGTDIVASYDGKNLASLNGVYDNDSKSVYIKVPELSDAFISVSSKDLETVKDEISSNLLSIGNIDNSSLSGFKKLLELKATDYEKIFNDYIKVVIDALPEASKEEDFSGSVSDVKYEYKLKTFTITSDAAKKIIEDIFAKLKNDNTIKELAVDILGDYLEITESNYTSIIDKLKDEAISSISSDMNEDISLIFDGKDIVGIKDKATFMCIDNKDAYVLSAESDSINCLFKATQDDGKLDYEYTANILAGDEYSKDVSVSVKADDLEIVDKENGLANGELDASIKSGDFNVKIEGTDKAESKKLSSVVKITVNDTEYAEITSTGEITNASDISVPDGKIYTLDQMEEYQASMKADEFMKSIQTALGEDLIAAITSSVSELNEEYSDYGYDGDISDVDDEDALNLEEYYKEDGSFDYDKLKEDLGEEDYEAFMSQIDIDDFEVDPDEIEL